MENFENIQRKDEKNQEDLLNEFNTLDDLGVANSVLTGKIFEIDEGLVLNRIKTIKIEAIRNEAYFRIAKIYAEKAKAIMNEITSKEEQERLLIHINNINNTK